MRSWALDKLQELRKGTGKLKLSDLEPTLLSLISTRASKCGSGPRVCWRWSGSLNLAEPLLKR